MRCTHSINRRFKFIVGCVGLLYSSFFFPFLTLTTLKLFWTANFNERRILLRKYTESGFERRGGDTHICFILEISSLHQTLKRETHILLIRNKHEFFTLLSQIKLITPDLFVAHITTLHKPHKSQSLFPYKQART